MFEFEREYTVQLCLLFPDVYREAFSVGSPICLYEGSRPVGTGIILATV